MDIYFIKRQSRTGVPIIYKMYISLKCVNEHFKSRDSYWSADYYYLQDTCFKDVHLTRYVSETFLSH